MPLATVQAQWEANFFDSGDGVTVTVSVTGKALDWQEGQGHPVLRLTCVASSDGGNLGLGFHFPAKHYFLEGSVSIEPALFKVGGHVTDANALGSIGYLNRSEDTVFHTLLASEGRALTKASAELILDLMSGDTLEVHFAQFPERYRVRYDLTGFAQSAIATMDQCKTAEFNENDVLANWYDKTDVVQLADD